MRPAPISVPGLQEAAARAEWGKRRYGSPAASRRRTAPERVEFRDSKGRRINRPALQGFACLWNEPFIHEGKIKIFEPTCFVASVSDTDSSKALLVDHDPEKVVGIDGLELEINGDGLIFRYSIDEDSAAAASVRDCLDGDAKVCMSVGCDIEQKETRKINGKDVEFVVRAKLREISLVPQGAVPDTFASLVSLDEVEPSLWEEARSQRFKTDKFCANITASARRTNDAVNRILRKLQGA